MDVFARDLDRSIGDDSTAEELLAEEIELRLDEFDERVAIELGRLLLERGLRDGLRIAFEVWFGDRLVFRVALPGTSESNDRYLASKLAISRETGHASLLASRRYRDRLAVDPALADDRRVSYGPYGGCVPLRVADGSVGGYAIVSGLSEQDDHAMIVWALRSLGAGGEARS